jgi:hypothetical protein
VWRTTWASFLGLIAFGISVIEAIAAAKGECCVIFLSSLQIRFLEWN